MDFRLWLLLTASLAAAPSAQAEMKQGDLAGIALGMTPDQVIAIAREKFRDPLLPEPQLSKAPCLSETATRAGPHSCITALTSGAANDARLTVLFVEDIPATPGTMRAYAINLAIDARKWSPADFENNAKALIDKFGKPSCPQEGPAVNYAEQAWAQGPIDCHEIDDVPSMMINGFPSYATDRFKTRSPMLVERVATGNFAGDNLILFSLGAYLDRLKAAKAAAPVPQALKPKF